MIEEWKHLSNICLIGNRNLNEVWFNLNLQQMLKEIYSFELIVQARQSGHSQNKQIIKDLMVALNVSQGICKMI